jgi:hypothetical protein
MAVALPIPEAAPVTIVTFFKSIYPPNPKYAIDSLNPT